MRHTIFNTPVLKHLMLGISLFFIKILGWKKAGRLPDEKKFVVIVAPHTSAWDVFYGAILAFAFRLDPRFIAKKELFRMPFGLLMKWMGGIPVDRGSKSRTVEQMTDLFKSLLEVLKLTPRYLTAAYPLALALGALTQKKWADRLATVVCVVLFVLYLIAFVLQWYVY